MVCSLPGSSVHGIFQARILEWVAISLSRGSSRPRDGTQVSRTAGRCFTLWATREVHIQMRMLCLLFLHTHINSLFYSLIPTYIKQHVSLLQRITDTHWPILSFPILMGIQFCSVAQSCPTLCDPMNRSTPGLPVHHQPPESTQTHVHQDGDAIQPSHPLSSPSPALNLSQHQGLFQWVSSSHQVAKVLEFQLQHQSLQWTPRTDLL